MRTFPSFLFLFLALLAGSTAYSQRANIWYFGDKAGLNFAGGTPVALTNGQLSTNEGCAVMSDNGGNLMFYTDGINIWNSTHNIVNPSNPMLGNASSSQSAVIIPRPGSNDRFFIFTMDQTFMGCQYGLNWTEVQVSGTNITILSINNSLLACADGTTEKLTAVCHPNGVDYWALTVKTSGEFYAFPVTSAGVGTPVVSAVLATPFMTTGTFYQDDYVGYIKASRQGNRVALARRHSSSVSELFSFNNATGQITANLGTYYTGVTYGIEFSPNGNYLYASHAFQIIKQYDVNTLTGTLIYTATGSNVGALQMGPDNKIYVANGYEGVDASTIDRIINPDSSTPTYNDNFLTLPAGTHSRLGLPDFVNCFFREGDGHPTFGVEDENVAENLNTYPNPAQDKLTVEMTIPSQQDVRLSLTSLDGKTVYTAVLENAGGLIQQTINVQSFATGMYLLRAEGKNFSAVQRVQVIR